MSYVAPSMFLRANKITITAGMILDPTELGMEAHPVFGPLPVVTVLEAKQDGSVFLLAEMTCPECGATRVIHPGDWFQVRACQTCTKRHQRKSRKVTKSEEEKEAAKAERDLKYAEDAIARAQAKAEEAKVRADELARALEERKALIAKVAAEKGVPVSQ